MTFSFVIIVYKESLILRFMGVAYLGKSKTKLFARFTLPVFKLTDIM